MNPKPPKTLSAISGQSFNYKFGAPFDKDGDEVTTKVDLGDAASFIKVVEIGGSIQILIDEATLADERVYSITLTLTDNNINNP